MQNGTAAIFRALAESSTSKLRSLYIEENIINEPVLEKLLAHLKSLGNRLKFLNLAKNPFSLDLLAKAAEKGDVALPAKMRVTVRHSLDEMAAERLQRAGVKLDLKWQDPSCVDGLLRVLGHSTRLKSA